MAPIKRSINALAKLKDNENGVARWFPLLLNHEPNGLPDVDLLREIDQDELISLKRSSNLQCTITRARYVPMQNDDHTRVAIVARAWLPRPDAAPSRYLFEESLLPLYGDRSIIMALVKFNLPASEDGAVDSPSKYKSLAAQASPAFKCQSTTYAKLCPTGNQILTVIKIGNPSSSYAFPPLALSLITTHTSITSSQTNMANPTAMTGADALQEPLPNLKRSSSQPPSGLAALSWFDEVLVPVEEAPQVLDDEELLAVLEEPKVRKMTRSGKIYGGKVTSSVDMGLAGKTLRQQLKEAKDRVEAKAQKE
ncbi:hypothetical protein CDV55_104881 [Aspergillus turcosus]|nr:hypothetical protein CDV55_104881 [Aspergillus turcosus]